MADDIRSERVLKHSTSRAQQPKYFSKSNFAQSHIQYDHFTTQELSDKALRFHHSAPTPVLVGNPGKQHFSMRKMIHNNMGSFKY